MSEKNINENSVSNEEKSVEKPELSDISFKPETAAAVAVKEKAEEDSDIKIAPEPEKIKKQKVNEEKPEQKTLVVKRPEKAKSTYESVENKPVSQPKPRKKRKKQSTFNNSIFGGFFIAFGVIVVAFIVALGGISLGKEYLGINKDQNDITFNIPKGSTSGDIAELLVENEIIEHETFFKLVFKLTAPDTIYPGDITLQPSMGYSAIINQLATMRESYETATITFSEGVTLLEVANLLEENGVCDADDFLFEFNKAQGYDFEEEITDTENAFYEMEGYFFPDTYEFYLNDTGYNVTKIVRENFEKKFTDKMLAKMKKQNLTMNQLMTLASMVQWEAGSVEDMPKVASVFLNRLNDPETFPAFQSDATAKYIDKVIQPEADTTATLEHYTECYDTYNYKGLPAGPVCNPGLDAINAVLDPADTDYYYFCNNLDTGKAYYAETLEEHEANLVKAGLA